MAEPKKKRSKTRTRRDRASKKITLASLVACKACGALIPSHTVCPHCGHYGSDAQTTPAV